MSDPESSPRPQPVAHVTVPLPPGPDTSFFDEAQWRVLFTLLDAVVPSIVSGAGAQDAYQITPDALETAQAGISISRAELEDYLAEKAADNPAFRDTAARMLSSAPPDSRKMLGTILNLLGTSWGSVPLTGHSRPFHTLTANQRSAVLRAWEASYLETFRFLAKTVTTLAKKCFVETSPQWARLSGWVDLPAYVVHPPASAYAPFKQFPPSNSPVPAVVDTDVVIVGSGCGGGVAAKVLAEAGLRVVVLDKAYYFPPEMLPMPSLTAQAHLFENGGAVASDDGSTHVTAGSAWGGGGTINWGVCLDPPDYVLQEWAQKDGLPFFTTPAFKEAVSRVSSFMGVCPAEAVPLNHRGRALLEGSARLGLDARPTPLNSGPDHHCGHCHLGCGGAAAKQGPAVSWLPAAARAGAEFIEGFQVERIVFDDDDGVKKGKGNKKRATGVIGKWVSRDKDGGVGGGLEERVTRDVLVRAKRVIVACGSIWTPTLLIKSGLKNPHIGKNLHCHPTNQVGGFWKEEVRPWEGCAITSVCTSLENLDNHGHGVKLEPMTMVPYLTYSLIPWHNALDFKLAALRYRHLQTYISIGRDRDTGTVYPDPTTGKPRVAYTPSAFDSANVLEGVLALARILYAAGAVEIRAYLPGVEPFVRAGNAHEDGDKNEDFQAWLRGVRAAGNPNTSSWATAHQMGSCRMGRSASAGAVDARGAVWEADGLYVADSSVFPSASGVNPMITIMAIADTIANGLVEELKGEGVKSVL
ncbi:long chain fatty alcohol oxidase [Camillea tinctor]|nr:long chain fatty alcohol oxidase [Camillea tinctor]